LSKIAVLEKGWEKRLEVYCFERTVDAARKTPLEGDGQICADVAKKKLEKFKAARKKLAVKKEKTFWGELRQK